MRVKLYLAIDDDLYSLERMPADPPVTIAWAVGKSGEPHHVHRDSLGRHCTCADFTMRGKENEPAERQCKHIRALVQARLL